jgi:hypothetical protein
VKVANVRVFYFQEDKRNNAMMKELFLFKEERNDANKI